MTSETDLLMRKTWGESEDCNEEELEVVKPDTANAIVSMISQAMADFSVGLEDPIASISERLLQVTGFEWSVTLGEDGDYYAEPRPYEIPNPLIFTAPNVH